MADLAYYLKISNHLAGNLDIRSALRSVKSEIDKIIPVDHLDVCLIDEDLHWNTSYEVGLRTSWSSTRAPIEVSPVRDILSGKQDFMITGNALEDERYTFNGARCEPIIKHCLKSRVNVAMKVLGQTIGSLNCSSKKAEFYTRNSVEQARNIADILAPYFYALKASESAKREAVIRTEIQAREEGLRVGALNLTEALEQERTRIGMDLHDQTLADLTHVVRDLESNSARIRTKDVIRDLQDCIQGLREIIDTSIPSILELFGFSHAIRTHTERAIGHGKDIAIDVADHTDGKIDVLDDSNRTALFRIAQEAVNNAARHSEASEISVVLTYEKGISLSIRDNGKSFDETSDIKRRGGLSHMQTRARLIAANFAIYHNEGTIIRVHIPEKADHTIGGIQ